MVFLAFFHRQTIVNLLRASLGDAEVEDTSICTSGHLPFFIFFTYFTETIGSLHNLRTSMILLQNCHELP